MAEIITKIRTKTSGDLTDVLVLIDHPMETGQRPDPKDKEKKVPAHYIQKLGIFLNGKEVATTDLGPAVSKEPLVGIKLKGAKSGDKIKVTWGDNKGQNGGGETTLG
jgi:sulfur-oxidizing protein SoxZ